MQPDPAGRQRLLFLTLATADLASPTVAWALYDGTTVTDPVVGDDDVPPYRSVLDAMRDGWRVIQCPQLPALDRDDPYAGAHLRYEYVLETWVTP